MYRWGHLQQVWGTSARVLMYRRWHPQVWGTSTRVLMYRRWHPQEVWDTSASVLMKQVWGTSASVLMNR